MKTKPWSRNKASKYHYLKSGIIIWHINEANKNPGSQQEQADTFNCLVKHDFIEYDLEPSLQNMNSVSSNVEPKKSRYITYIYGKGPTNT